MIFGKQDTHVDREGRSMIRDGLDAGGGAVSVSFERGRERGRGRARSKARRTFSADFLFLRTHSSTKSKPSTPLSETPLPREDGMLLFRGRW